MRYILSAILLINYLVVFSQDSGTFKVTKKEKKQEKVRSNVYTIGLESTFAGNSSPKLVRDVNLSFSCLLRQGSHGSIFIGIIAGNSQPNINYKGTTLGGFTSIKYTLLLGPGSISFPLEISYNKLFNKLEYPNLNQYTVGGGLSFNPFLFIGTVRRAYNKSFLLTFLGKYHYDTNSIDTFKGFYPAVRLEYRFY